MRDSRWHKVHNALRRLFAGGAKTNPAAESAEAHNAANPNEPADAATAEDLGVQAEASGPIGPTLVPVVLTEGMADSEEPEPDALVLDADEPGEAVLDTPDPWDETDALILRSTDVIASLADLVRHGDAPSVLIDAVTNCGLLTWENAPRVEAKRLRRNGNWWLWAEDDLADAAYDQMAAVELALNLADDMRFELDGFCEGVPFPFRAKTLLSEVIALEPLGAPDENTRFLAQGAEEGGEWATRLSLADYAQSLPVPLRVDIDLQVNVADGIVVADIEVPRPDVFACVSDKPERRAAHARTYAMTLCLLIGRGAFAASERVSRVVVNGHEHGTRTPVISVDLTPGGLERLVTELCESKLGELPRGLGIRWFASADGRLSPVDPFMAVWDENVAPLSRWCGIEENRRPVNAPLAKATKASTYADLGINEKTVRIDAWNEASGWLGVSTRRAVAAFEARRRRATDLSVADACERVSRALVAGDIDVFDRQSMALLFVEGGELTRTVIDVANQLNARPGHTSEELRDALSRLDAALEPAQQTARYEDDTRYVFRFFNSVVERVRYNQTIDDKGRELRLVPDEYYAAHTQATIILTALGRHEEALKHADELARIAPVTPDATLTRVRVLEELSRIYEAEAALKEAIGFASCLHDLATCFYRLAFMEWKLGRGQLSVACYQRAAELHNCVHERAAKELVDVLSAGEGLRRLSRDEAREAILAAGLPYGDVDQIRTMARDAAVACADAGLLGTARPLVGVLLEAEQDDVLMSVYGSLTPAHP